VPAQLHDSHFHTVASSVGWFLENERSAKTGKWPTEIFDTDLAQLQHLAQIVC
jgi:hypothetical protein